MDGAAYESAGMPGCPRWLPVETAQLSRTLFVGVTEAGRAPDLRALDASRLELSRLTWPRGRTDVTQQRAVPTEEITALAAAMTAANAYLNDWLTFARMVDASRATYGVRGKGPTYRWSEWPYHDDGAPHDAAWPSYATSCMRYETFMAAWLLATLSACYGAACLDAATDGVSYGADDQEGDDDPDALIHDGLSALARAHHTVAGVCVEELRSWRLHGAAQPPAPCSLEWCQTMMLSCRVRAQLHSTARLAAMQSADVVARGATRPSVDAPLAVRRAVRLTAGRGTLAPISEADELEPTSSRARYARAMCRMARWLVGECDELKSLTHPLYERTAWSCEVVVLREWAIVTTMLAAAEAMLAERDCERAAAVDAHRLLTAAVEYMRRPLGDVLPDAAADARYLVDAEARLEGVAGAASAASLLERMRASLRVGTVARPPPALAPHVPRWQHVRRRLMTAVDAARRRVTELFERSGWRLPGALLGPPRTLTASIVGAAASTLTDAADAVTETDARDPWSLVPEDDTVEACAQSFVRSTFPWRMIDGQAGPAERRAHDRVFSAQTDARPDQPTKEPAKKAAGASSEGVGALIRSRQSTRTTA